MDEFADFKQNLKPENVASYKPVKIALIDDGADTTEEFLYKRFLGGQSFCPKEETNLSSSYYVRGGGHGTAMARLICRVCPNAQLFVQSWKSTLARIRRGK